MADRPSKERVWGDFAEQVRKSVGGPGECHCTGACEPDPTQCPAYGHSRKTFAELIEPFALNAEAPGLFHDPEKAAILRAAVAADDERMAAAQSSLPTLISLGRPEPR